MPSTVIGCLYVNFLLPEMKWPHFECKYYSLWYGRRIAKNLYIELKGGKCFCWISRWEVRWRHGFGGRTEAFQRRLKSHRWWDRIPWSYGSHDEWTTACWLPLIVWAHDIHEHFSAYWTERFQFSHWKKKCTYNLWYWFAESCWQRIHEFYW